MIARETGTKARAVQQEGSHDEAARVVALKARSPEAWTQLYDQNYQRIYRYALARTSDPTTAEDLAATVFLEALKGIHSYSYRGRPILAWLYGIARNVVSDHRKASRRAPRGATDIQSRVLWFFLRSRRPGDPPRDEVTVGEAASTDGDPAAQVERLDVQAAVRRLTGSQREVIILRYYMGLRTPEVAALLGKKERAVYSLQMRALEALRRQLGSRL